MSEDKERKEFEAWAVKVPLSVATMGRGFLYDIFETEVAHRAWQHRAALSAARISDLEKALRDLAETARGSVELDDWPELQAALANADAL